RAVVHVQRQLALASPAPGPLDAEHEAGSLVILVVERDRRPTAKSLDQRDREHLLQATEVLSHGMHPLARTHAVSQVLAQRSCQQLRIQARQLLQLRIREDPDRVAKRTCVQIAAQKESQPAASNLECASATVIRVMKQR